MTLPNVILSALESGHEIRTKEFRAIAFSRCTSVRFHTNDDLKLHIEFGAWCATSRRWSELFTMVIKMPLSHHTDFAIDRLFHLIDSWTAEHGTAAQKVAMMTRRKRNG